MDHHALLHALGGWGDHARDAVDDFLHGCPYTPPRRDHSRAAGHVARYRLRHAPALDLNDFHKLAAWLNQCQDERRWHKPIPHDLGGLLERVMNGVYVPLREYAFDAIKAERPAVVAAAAEPPPIEPGKRTRSDREDIRQEVLRLTCVPGSNFKRLKLKAQAKAVGGCDPRTLKIVLAEMQAAGEYDSGYKPAARTPTEELPYWSDVIDELTRLARDGRVGTARWDNAKDDMERLLKQPKVTQSMRADATEVYKSESAAPVRRQGRKRELQLSDTEWETM